MLFRSSRLSFGGVVRNGRPQSRKGWLQVGYIFRRYGSAIKKIQYGIGVAFPRGSVATVVQQVRIRRGYVSGPVYPNSNYKLSPIGAPPLVRPFRKLIERPE
ncbi:hypothetical protein Zmor_025022 [Zophobas morio]|uniref:Uncharacterized protein n=1 Tax=Zophobas morio TaxID=2755281 RepID=A0AA38M478_9CUCU|nr:hypothetical protein Zmor_025022 [Zophobas morio]